jgi:hypothetical protein
LLSLHQRSDIRKAIQPDHTIDEVTLFINACHSALSSWERYLSRHWYTKRAGDLLQQYAEVTQRNFVLHVSLALLTPEMEVRAFDALLERCDKDCLSLNDKEVFYTILDHLKLRVFRIGFVPNASDVRSDSGRATLRHQIRDPVTQSFLRTKWVYAKRPENYDNDKYDEAEFGSIHYGVADYGWC